MMRPFSKIKLSCLTAFFAVAILLGVAMVANSQSVGDANSSTLPIVMDDVPLNKAIEVLSRQAGINYLVDSRLTEWWSLPTANGHTTHEPTITIHWNNLTPSEGLSQLLAEHNLVLLEDPITSIARITYTNQVANPFDVSFLGDITNKFIQINMQRMPIEFEAVPITTALENLARASGINYALDPEIGYGMPDRNGRIKPEPTLFVRWYNVTAIQAFIAICENYDLVLAKDPVINIVQIRVKNHPLTNFVDAGLLGSYTNWTAPMEFQDVPITTVLEALARLAGINYILDPKIGYGKPDKNGQIKPEPTLFIRWEKTTPAQAFFAICECYDWVAVKDSTTGIIRIKPID
jgi:hypothetical protein